MMKVANFNEALEKDLARLTTKIEEQRGEEKRDVVSGRELVRQSLESMTTAEISTPTSVEEKILPSVVTPIPESSPSSGIEFLPAYLRGDTADPKIQKEIERLVHIVLAEGFEKVMREIKNYSPFVQDAFHDALTDVLLPELERRGIV